MATRHKAADTEAATGEEEEEDWLEDELVRRQIGSAGRHAAAGRISSLGGDKPITAQRRNQIFANPGAFVPVRGRRSISTQ